MGLFDWFIPDPPIPCPVCGGELTGWQGKHDENALYVWTQHVPNPVKQDGNPEFDGGNTEGKRLNDGRIEFDYGACRKCGFDSWRADIHMQLVAVIENRVWTRTETDPPARPGRFIDADWLQCPECANAWQIGGQQPFIICRECKTIIRVPAHDKSA